MLNEFKRYFSNCYPLMAFPDFRDKSFLSKVYLRALIVKWLVDTNRIQKEVGEHMYLMSVIGWGFRYIGDKNER